ncbi:Heparanase-like protein 1 [Ananas comosus]|uniref:Heparanase-like protein 1 n=1 Tax=Ananas comosus TaxID=4615 RepID=A0A199W468_ANACO|nr:Heparanase-like protein 1 [Ananas comosus]
MTTIKGLEDSLKKKIEFTTEGMGMSIVFALLLCSLNGILSDDTADVTVIVKGSSTIAETNENFVCATIDWWPPEKCSYNQCPWGQSSVLNLVSFNPLRIRVGGSLQDQVVYGMPNLGHPCVPFSKKAGGAIITFGLNALYGRHPIRKGIWGGAWNSSNTRKFIEYTISKSYRVDSWEFGNELSGHGVGASVGAEQYGRDLIVLKSMLDELYSKSRTKPLLLAPGGFYEQQWYAQLLQVSGSGTLNGMTHHIYNLGGGNDPHIASKITDPQYLSRVADTFRDLQLTLQRHGPWASAWVGEAGGAYNSGSRLVSNTFLNSFWYLDQLGLSSKYHTKAYCRQTLIGGYYGLLDTKTFIPNPDYYSALLWHRLMGKGVLSVDISGSPYLRAYAHCSKHKAGVSVLLINLNRSRSFTVTVRNDINVDLAAGAGIARDGSLTYDIKRTVSWVGSKASDGPEKREEYHLTAQDGNHLSRTMLLNGTPLELTEDGDVPAMEPLLAPVNSAIYVAPMSMAFVVFPNFEARACGR